MYYVLVLDDAMYTSEYFIIRHQMFYQKAFKHTHNTKKFFIKYSNEYN